MSAQVEVWRVNTAEGMFETNLETLKQRIVEGCVLPTDKVSKGSLSWIEAGRAPMLRAAFNGDVAQAAVIPTTASASEQDPQQNKMAATPEFDVVAPVEPPSFVAAHEASACYNHPESAPEYVCRACASTFCAACPKYSNTIALCPSCGDLCRPFQEVRDKGVRREFQASGFGFEDFTRALRYPLQHKIALLFGAALYGFLLLGGFRGRVIAFVIMFGCISHVISQVAWGKLDRSFLPDFGEFSLWDDVAVPLGLGIGITIVTWGPVIVIVLALLLGLFKGPSLSPVSALAAPDVSQQKGVTREDLSVLTDPNADPKKLEEVNARLNQLRPGSQMAQEAEASKKELSDPASDLRSLLSFFHVPFLIAILFLLSLVWAVFYYPMALAVAGYTEHFGSVVNPMVGLDTIRRMGATYFKAFGIVLLVQLVGFVISVIVATILRPFALPFFGNLPAKFVDGSVAFYFNLVIACTLGLALHKCADRLGIGVE
jgi:hypothetical protein